MPDIQGKKPTVLLIIDGFGVAPDSDGNAITRAKMPVFEQLVKTYPAMTLKASGEEVGLSWGEMGNSEVGHLNIGAGRVYYQMLPKIDKAIADTTFFQNEAFLKAVAHVKQSGGTLHVAGLMSGGRIHSLDSHAHTLLQLAKDSGLTDVAVHAFLDGRDTVYNAGADFIQHLLAKMEEIGVGRLATMSGRYYAMDRDNHWDRTKKAYNAMVWGKGVLAEDPMVALRASYEKEIYDEEFVPVVLTKKDQPIAQIKENDAIIFFNFRPDRMRQITKMLSLPAGDISAGGGFAKLERAAYEHLLVVTMAEYESGLPVEVAFPPDVIDQPLAQVISEAGLKQLHVAETEKYAHVTFFLNGTKEDPFEGEERVIISSPQVSSYKEVPEMSAREITNRLVKELKTGMFDFYVANFANPDMVAHTGDLKATIMADEVIDECLGKIIQAALAQDGTVLITADHGNAEELQNLRTADMDKAHSTNPVPLLIISNEYEGQSSIAGEVPEGDLSLLPPVGMLADVAPTVLKVMGLKQPEQMTGQSLL